MSKISGNEIQKKYALGERNFRQVDVRYALLKGINLSHSDLNESILVGANLCGADLRGTNLCGANLTRANLNEACLKGAILTRGCLDEVDLVDACLEKAHLNGVELKKANLSGADLSGAYLIKANLSGANLSGANLSGSNLCGANLSGANLSGAYYSDNTYFDIDFEPVSAGMQKVKNTTVEELLVAFNYIYQLSNNYLGSKLAASYIESSRPNFDWLSKFQIDRAKGVTFSGGLIETITMLQLQWCQKWINAFINCCSQIIQDFPRMIDREQLGVLASVAENSGDVAALLSD